MSGMRRAGPGPQLSTGRLRVDAGRAIAKLREYQLADRTAWILEVIRAAVAAKATKISLAGDANDIWLAWEGEPFELEALPKLFDELVSPAAEDDRQHVRLLAAGVNSALGMEPSYVDVYAVAGDNVQVARYTPDVLAEPTGELGDTPLRRIEARPAELPHDAPLRSPGASGAVVHLRRRFGLALLSYALGEPPEIEVARQACRDIAVPLHIGDEVLHRDHTHDVVRVPIGDGISGFLAASDRVVGEAQLEVAEHGVVLARYGLRLHPIVPVPTLPSSPPTDIPVRLFVDAERMPTNASRSQVRRDQHPISTAVDRAEKLVGEVVQQLAAAVTAGDDRARSTALAWIAAEIGGPQWHVNAPGIRGEMRELAKLRLVKNAVGEARALTNHWGPEVYTGRTPYPTELSAWLSDVLWVPPGDASSRLLDGAYHDAGAMRRLVRWAKREARAQRKFYSHQKRDARVIVSRKPRVRARLGAEVEDSCVDQKVFAGLTGEICVYDEGRGATLVVLLEGRELERIAVKSTFAFDAVVDSSQIKPNDRYRGVARDGAFGKVERAMLLGLVRAIEALAIERTGRADLLGIPGYELGPDRGAEADARLFRAAYTLLTDVSLKLKGPLANAPAWLTTDGRWIGPNALTGTIGVIRPSSGAFTPRGRTVVYADDDERVLFDLVRGRVVRYDRYERAQVTGGTDGRTLARELASGRPGAFAIPDADLAAAIAPATKSTLQLRHAGVKLATHPYKSKYLDCAIVVESDAVVPDTDWKSALDDAGLLGRDYGAWELALVRSIAWTLVGVRSPELLGPPVLELGAGLGLALCEALERGEPRDILGDELIAKLRAVPLVEVLGGTKRLSVAEIAAQFPTSKTIPFISVSSEPVADFTPVLSTARVANAIAKLCGRNAKEASGELAQRQKRALFQRRLDAHCAQPAETVPPAGGGRVEFLGQVVRGTVGLSDGPFTIRVLVENRPLTTLRPTTSLPLDAVVELAATHCGDTFDGLDSSATGRIATDVRAAIPALLDAIADASPEKLGDPGPGRTLMGEWVAPVPAETRQKLASRVTFRTIQGGRVSIEQAAQPRLLVSTADWADPWLPPGDGEAPSSLDEPVLFLGKNDAGLARIFEHLHDGVIVDASDEVARLQARRRMVRGLLPTPKVTGIPTELKRSLADLPDAKKLGPGEIGLAVDSNETVVRIHVNGRFDRVVKLAVEPPIELAVEEQVLDADLVQKLAGQLVAAIVVKGTHLIPSPARRHLFRATLGKRIDPEVLGELAFCETREAWHPWSSFVAQGKKFGQVWAVAGSTQDLPLDEDRVVFMLDAEAIARANKHGYNVMEATQELALDAQARKNRAKPPATSLALPTLQGVLAQVELGGDGTTSPAGTVAVLAPAARFNRGMYPHHAMYPFERTDDPCVWPTIAVVNDARLEPDRTWASPKSSDAWQSLQKAVRAASERALATLRQPPSDAIVSLHVDAASSAEIKELRRSPKSQVRGVVWLAGMPFEDQPTIQVTHGSGTRTFSSKDQLALGGSVLVFEDERDKTDLDALLEQLSGTMYGKLVRELLKRRESLDADFVTAHVAHALALQAIKPTETRGVEFTCFKPRPLDARGLTSLLRRNSSVRVLTPVEACDVDLALVEDNSFTSRVLLAHLGKRVRRKRPETEPLTPAPPQPVLLTTAPSPEAKHKPKPAPRPAAPPAEPEPPHPLQGIIERLSKRVGELGLVGYEWFIDDTAEPMFRFSGEIKVGGDNPKLRALAVALLANSPWLDDAIDVVAAHVVTVLNVAQTSVTDATEISALGVLLARQRSSAQPRLPGK